MRLILIILWFYLCDHGNTYNNHWTKGNTVIFCPLRGHDSKQEQKTAVSTQNWVWNVVYRVLQVSISRDYIQVRLLMSQRVTCGGVFIEWKNPLFYNHVCIIDLWYTVDRFPCFMTVLTLIWLRQLWIFKDLFWQRPDKKYSSNLNDSNRDSLNNVQYNIKRVEIKRICLDVLCQTRAVVSHMTLSVARSDNETTLLSHYYTCYQLHIHKHSRGGWGWSLVFFYKGWIQLYKFPPVQLVKLLNLTHSWCASLLLRLWSTSAHNTRLYTQTKPLVLSIPTEQPHPDYDDLMP